MNSHKYKDYFTSEFLMGPNSIVLLQELLTNQPQSITGGTILDLGCGKALTSIYIANETKANTVYATDLWITATENWKAIKQWKLEEKIIPIRANSMELPFADEYFDTIVSIDSFHYYGCQEQFFANKILPLLKSGGYAIFAIPGIKEVQNNQLFDLMIEWVGEATSIFHSVNWWENHIKEGCEDQIELQVYEAAEFDSCWKDWISTGHEYAIRDEKFLNRGLNKLLNFVMIVVQKK